jgi:diguanylate cyclase (GGDEF)-like protein
MRDYNKLLQERIDRKFNIALIAAAIIAFTGSVILYFADIPGIYSVLNFITAVIMLLLTLMADKVKTTYKIMVMILVTSIIAIASYIGGGFASAFIILIAVSNVVAVLFLNRVESKIVSTVTVIILSSLCIYSYYMDENNYAIDFIFTWSLIIVAFILFIIVLHVSVHATKQYLMENIEALELANEYSNKLAYFDQLTALPNAHMFEKDVKCRIESLDTVGFLIFINLKSLRSINSTMGHSFGNKALISAAETISEMNVENLIVARTSGNEFAIWVEDIEEKELQIMLRDLMNKIKVQSFVVKKKSEFYSGYSKFDIEKDSYERCVQKAATALAYAKDQNITSIVPYKGELDAILRRKEALKDHIELALENNEFTLWYQSKTNTQKGKVIGVEALARWNNEDLGTVFPYEFIPIIESINMAKIFGDFVIKKACEDYSKLKEKYNKDISISVNISPSHIMERDIVSSIKSSLEEHDVSPEKFIVEITEEITIEDIDIVVPILNDLRDLKIKISLDDFGTGYSSLNYLTKLSLDEIKIDKSFVDQIGKEKGIEHLLESIIRLSKQFDLNVVAEGVEREDQLIVLNNLGCYNIQGYYYAKAEPLIESISM